MSTWDFPDHGCDLGKVLGETIPPWSPSWEQHVNDSCAHRWEVVVVTRLGLSRQPVVRCAKCYVPRCGHWSDEDPCMDRRHHEGVHVYLSGQFEPIGGVLPDHPEEAA